MYNRYVRNDDGRYERVTMPEEPPFDGYPPGGGEPPPHREDTYGPPPGGASRGPGPPPGGERKGFLSGLLDRLNLKNLDTEDLLLLLIIYLLYREGEDEELLLALGLLLVL
ncbi:MAG: hypothetical protein HDT14_09670 [Oscillibacter sp.]|nr:hypothetical protein [Oscillibacter sp.]